MIPNKSKAFKTFSMGSCHLSRHISVSHTIMKGGPLWLGFGNLRDKVVDKLKDLRKKYSDFVINSEKNYL
jgi:lipoate synthase